MCTWYIIATYPPSALPDCCKPEYYFCIGWQLPDQSESGNSDWEAIS